MKYGFVFPGGSAREIADRSIAAEAAGWDAVFVSEGHYGVDAWVTLGAIATSTERIRMGTMITPLPWRRPWTLAGRAVTVDQLSDGRVTLAVGLGAVDAALGDVGEDKDRRTRAERLDEGLTIIDGLWKGEPLRHKGKHYDVKLNAGPRSVQQPRIPIWVVGAWPRMRSMQRVLRADGLLPVTMASDGAFSTPTPDEVRAMKAFVEENRPEATTPFDIVMEGETPADDPAAAAARVAPLEEAGCTWWLETRWTDGDAKAVEERIAAGPPGTTSSGT